jgi:raffinose/stachyose/melibiose transport system permease protein
MATTQVGAPTPEVGAPPPTKRRSGGPGRPHPGLYLFALPALTLYVIFFAYPTLQGIQYSITNWDGFSGDWIYVGLNNFANIFTNDDLFKNALVNNIKFMLVVVLLQTAFALMLAVFLAKNSRGSILLRALFFFPTILSSISVAFVWRFVYDPNFGLANRFLGGIGLDRLQSSYLGNETAAIYWVALSQVWFHTGQVMVIFVAGLQSVPKELYEAAEIDGANKWQQFRSVTWPMIAPATAIVVAYTTVQSFKAFDLILGLGGNPPKPSLDILSTRIFTTFSNSEFGYAAAESLVFMALILVVTVAQRRLLKMTTQES